MSPRNTTSGGVLEAMIIPALKRGGYAYLTQQLIGERWRRKALRRCRRGEGRMIATDGETALDMARGRDWRRALTPRVPDVQAIRGKLGLSQSEFANRFGFCVRTVQERAVAAG